MLVSQAIERAKNLLFAGQSLRAGEQSNALASFQAMMRDLPGLIGASWCDVVGYDGYVAGEDERISCFSDMSIGVPDYILKEEGWGVRASSGFNSNTMRTPYDGARVQVVDQGGADELWFYRADRASWFAVGALGLNSDVPLNSEFDRYIPSMLAVHMRPEYPGANLDKATVFLAERGYAKLRARLARPRRVSVDAALLNLSIQTGSRAVQGGSTRARPEILAQALAELHVGLGELVNQLGGTLDAALTGTIYSNSGATSVSTFVLPAAAAGLRYGFVVRSSSGLRVTAQAGDTIGIGMNVSASGGRVDSVVVGSALYLLCINGTEWVATSDVGEWTVT
jgi:hypothetical protein